jgi:hypothetical protein
MRKRVGGTSSKSDMFSSFFSYLLASARVGLISFLNFSFGDSTTLELREDDLGEGVSGTNIGMGLSAVVLELDCDVLFDGILFLLCGGLMDWPALSVAIVRIVLFFFRFSSRIKSLYAFSDSFASSNLICLCVTADLCLVLRRPATLNSASSLVSSSFSASFSSSEGKAQSEHSNARPRRRGILVRGGSRQPK